MDEGLVLRVDGADREGFSEFVAAAFIHFSWWRAILEGDKFWPKGTGFSTSLVLAAFSRVLTG
jgi:hypothetical protein